MSLAVLHRPNIVDHCPASADRRCDLVASGVFPDPTGKVGEMTIALSRSPARRA